MTGETASDRSSIGAPLGVGAAAPDFELPGTDGTPEGHRVYALSAYRGQPVVLVFYPADNTPVCTVQLTTYTEDIARFAEAGAQVLALSPQSVSAATSSPPRRAGSRSRCSPTRSTRRARPTACSGRSASTGGRCS